MDALDSGGDRMPDVDDAPGVGLGNLEGRQIGRYLIGPRIGTGGVATVYRAYDQVQGVTVALKVLQPTADVNSLDRFKREALTAGALRHPNIVRILQVGAMPQGEVAYIAMDLVEGESLADLLGQRGSLHWEESCALLAPIADALGLAHAAGIVHRDVKPSNILLRPAQRGEANSVTLESLDYPVVPLLSDFGIARTMDAPELTSAGRTVGTPAYMAPEQASASRSVDGRADIYALGTVLYRCITGRLPYTGSATQILHAHVYEPLLIDSHLLSQLPPDLVRVLQRTLAKNPANRYATAGELAEALARLGKSGAATHAWADPNATHTISPAALPALAAPHDSTSTSVLVPGIVAEPRAAAALPGATPVTITGQATPIEPDGGAKVPPKRQRSLLLRLTAVAAIFLLLGFLAGFVTLVARSRGAASPTAEPTVIALRPTSTPTPSATVTPTRPVPTPTTDVNLIPIAPVAPTATPLPSFVLEDTPTPEPSTSTPTATDTLTPSPTATPWPTDPPTLTPTWTPQPVLTAIGVPATETSAPPAPTPGQGGSGTPPGPEPPAGGGGSQGTPVPQVTPGPEACAHQVAPILADYIADHLAGNGNAFLCPQDEPATASAEIVPFQNGTMLRLPDSGDILISTIDGTWQRVPGNSGGEDDDLTAPDGLYLPPEAFRGAWGDARERLGYALAPGSQSFSAVQQEFDGGTLIGNLDSGSVYLYRAGGGR